MKSRHPPGLTLFAAALILVSGCGGTTRTLDKSFPAASDWFEGAPHSIAVLPGDYVPRLSLSYPDARADGAATASAGGATSTVVAGCGSDPLSNCSDAASAASFGARAESGKEVKVAGNGSAYVPPSLKEAAEQLEHTLADRRPHLLISHAVASRIRERTAYDGRLKSFRGYPEEYLPEGPSNGLVEIGLTKFGLVIDGQPDQTVDDPRVALEIGASAHVYAIRERKFVPEAIGGWCYQGNARRLSKWTAENGRLLNEEIERAASSIAKRIVK